MHMRAHAHKMPINSSRYCLFPHYTVNLYILRLFHIPCSFIHPILNWSSHEIISLHMPYINIAWKKNNHKKCSSNWYCPHLGERTTHSIKIQTANTFNCYYQLCSFIHFVFVAPGIYLFVCAVAGCWVFFSSSVSDHRGHTYTHTCLSLSLSLFLLWHIFFSTRFLC